MLSLSCIRYMYNLYNLYNSNFLLNIIYIYRDNGNLIEILPVSAVFVCF